MEIFTICPKLLGRAIFFCKSAGLPGKSPPFDSCSVACDPTLQTPAWKAWEVAEISFLGLSPRQAPERAGLGRVCRPFSETSSLPAWCSSRWWLLCHAHIIGWYVLDCPLSDRLSCKGGHVLSLRRAAWSLPGTWATVCCQHVCCDAGTALYFIQT